MDDSRKSALAAIERARDRSSDAQQRLAEHDAPPQMQAAVHNAHNALDELLADLLREQRAA